MSHQAIDQLLQITTPKYSGPEAARTGSADRDLFRAHLNRAAEVAEPKPAADKKEDEAEPIQKDEPLEPRSGQQETSTTEQEQTVATKSSEPTAETPEESPAEQESADEVTLSAAAAAQPTEVATTAEQVASTDEVVEAALADGQQQSGEQPTPQSAEATNDSATSTTGTGSVELEAALLGEGVVGESASETDESSVEAEAEVRATKTTVRTEADQLAGAAAVEGEAKKSQSSATTTSANGQQTMAKQPSAGDVSDALPGTEIAEGSTKTASGRFDVPTSTTTNELATTTTDAELALANLNNTTEPVGNASNASTPSSADTVAAAGRTVGNLLAGKSAASAGTATTESSTNETPAVDRAKFVQRVGGAIRSAQNRDGQIQLRLSPPELGTLRINIVLNEGVLTAHLETETNAARAVLLDNLPALRERLAEQEIRIEKFDVNVGQEGQQQAENRDTDDRQTNRSRSQSNQQSTRAKETSSTVTESDPTQSVTASGLDVRI